MSTGRAVRTARGFGNASVRVMDNLKRQFHLKHKHNPPHTPTEEAKDEFELKYTMLVLSRNIKIQRKYKEIGKGVWGRHVAGRKGQYAMAVPRGLHGDTMGVPAYHRHPPHFLDTHGLSRTVMGLRGNAIGVLWLLTS